MDRVRIPAAGDPFASFADKPRASNHACNDGWVSMEVEAEDGTLEEVLYLCKRCAEEKTKRAEGV